MQTKPPHLSHVAIDGPATLIVVWKTDACETIDLSGWIATGGMILAPLQDTAVFGTARLGTYGASIDWGAEDCDLAIDAVHLSRIAEEQRNFGRVQFLTWQDAMGMSNQEAADFLGLALSTLNAYRAGANVPKQIAMLCRAAKRDPILMHAHFRPRKAGRPRNVIAVANGS